MEGFGPQILKKSTGLRLLVWRDFIMTVHILVWVIALMMRFCCSIYHELLLFLKEIRAFWGTIRAHKSPQWPLITFSCIHSLRWYNLQQNGMSYAIFYCQKPEIYRSDQNFTSRDHLFWSRLSLLKGLGPPIINITSLYKLILVWRCFIKTVPYKNLGHNSDDKILYLSIWEVTAVIIAF